MKVEFEFTLDHSGRAVIKFNHYDKDDSLEQKVLREFIKFAKVEGIELINTGSFGEIDNNQTSHDSYLIATKFKP